MCQWLIKCVSVSVNPGRTEFFQAFFSQLHRLLSEVAAIIFFVFILTSTVRLLDCFNDRRFSLCRLDFYCFKSLRVLV